MEKQIRYIAQWFNEWSELQKDDFFNVLLSKFDPNDADALQSAMDTLKVTDKPPSLFKCQMKLFNEWFDCWSEAERGSLMVRLKDVDDDFVQKIESKISCTF